MELTVQLSSQQQLQDGQVLRVGHLYMCEEVGADSCFNKLTVMVG